MKTFLKISCLGLGAILTLSGCSSTSRVAQTPSNVAAKVSAFVSPQAAADADGAFGAPALSAYAAVNDDGFQLPAIPTEKMDPRYLRQRVVYDGRGYAPGTVVVDTADRFLYLIESGGTAMRYGIGVGKDGFSWAGEARIGDKQHWPRWFPPMEMIDRRPDLEEYRHGLGMDPGLSNPLGARALYLYQGEKDTLYRLHGTPEWWSIGTAASSGCIRLINQDILDLYERVPLEAKVVVLQGNEKLAPPPADKVAANTGRKKRRA